MTRQMLPTTEPGDERPAEAFGPEELVWLLGPEYADLDPETALWVAAGSLGTVKQ